MMQYKMARKGRTTLWDWIKGAAWGAGSAAGTVAYNTIYHGLINHEKIYLSIGQLGSAAAGGLFTYIVHKLFTDDFKVAKKRIEKAGGTVWKPITTLPIK